MDERPVFPSSPLNSSSHLRREEKTVSVGSPTDEFLRSRRDTSERLLKPLALLAVVSVTVIFFLLSRCSLQLWRTRRMNLRKLSEEVPGLVDPCNQLSPSIELERPETEGSDATSIPVIPPAPISSTSTSEEPYDFSRVSNFDGGDRAKVVLKEVLVLLQRLAAFKENLGRRNLAGVYSTSFKGVDVKIFVEKNAVVGGWPYDPSLESVGQLLEEAFLQVVEDAKRAHPAHPVTRSTSLTANHLGVDMVTITLTLVGKIPGNVQREQHETEYFF